MSFITKILGDANEKSVKGLMPFVDATNALEEEIVKLSDEELRARADKLKKAIQKEGHSLDDALPEAFALVRETAHRTLGERHYDVQLMGGVAMHQGKIVEMRTGEGKTLAATAPIVLNAMTGKGVHVITVNDYLAKRDAGWMGQVYFALGLSVGCITQEGSFRYADIAQAQGEELDEERDEKGSFRVFEEYLEAVEKKDAYACDITYGTNNEFGFDYLRDNMVLDKAQMAQREHYFAIVDEVDSILIDEARTPLIISAPDSEAPQQYQLFAKIAPRLKEGEDYELDEKRKSALVTEGGVRKVEEMLGIGNMYEEGLRMVHFLEQSLRAQVLYKRDKDYIVRDGEVVIVDEFTGRLMAGRRWSEGLHQAVEAKEGVKLQAESRTLATITFQNYFRMYQKLSGMTGTAATSAEEFSKVYEIEVLILPTNKPLIREDLPDMVFSTTNGKWSALVKEIRKRHEKGQPILIGTTSIEKNELVSKLLEREGVQHEVLNAKQHAREGAILAQAGRKGAVTVATNMAGRGVDIILGGNPSTKEMVDEVCKLGGLTVFGTERHEARRIDNQLRGRAGRQGDPGASQFFMSLEDDLLRVFGGDKIQGLMAKMNVAEDQPIESKMVSRAIESAQARIEGQNFDIRKHLLDYDDVTNKHRDAIYKRRRALLMGADADEALEELLGGELDELILIHLNSDLIDEWNLDGFRETLGAIIPIAKDADGEIETIVRGEGKYEEKREAIRIWALNAYATALTARKNELGEEKMEILKRQALLRAIDGLWMEHLETMDALRDSVRLRAYGQRDPLVEYKAEAVSTFRRFEAAIRARTLQVMFRASMHQNENHSHQHKHVTENRSDKKEQPIRKKAPVGRNDPCPCGSGLKYKRCGLINASEHRT